MAFFDFIGNGLDWLGNKIVNPIVDGVASFATSVVDNLIGSGLFDSAGDLLTKATGQEKLLDAQQQFTQSERIASQEYNTSERLSSQAWQQNMWQEQQRTGAALQIQGMVDAGINPNTAVASLGGTSAVPSSTNTGAPSGEVVGAPSPAPLGSLFEILPQMMKVKSESNLADALASKAREETKGIVYDNNTKPILNDLAITEAKGRINLLEEQGKLDAAQSKQILDMLPLMKDKTWNEISKMSEEIANLGKEREMVALNIQQLQMKIKTERELLNGYTTEEYEAYWNSERSKSAIALNGKQMDLIGAEKYLKEQQARLAQLDADWTESNHKYGIDPHASDVYNLCTFFLFNKDKFVEVLNSIKGKIDNDGWHGGASNDLDPGKPGVDRPIGHSDFGQSAVLDGLYMQ